MTAHLSALPGQLAGTSLRPWPRPPPRQLPLEPIITTGKRTRIAPANTKPWTSPGNRPSPAFFRHQDSVVDARTVRSSNLLSHWRACQGGGTIRAYCLPRPKPRGQAPGTHTAACDTHTAVWVAHTRAWDKSTTAAWDTHTGVAIALEEVVVGTPLPSGQGTTTQWSVRHYPVVKRPL